jgi:hypothetical protein
MGQVGPEFHLDQSWVMGNHCVKVLMTFCLLLNGGVDVEHVVEVADGDPDID